VSPKSTHTLEGEEGSTFQDAKSASEGHSHTGEVRERDKSGHGNKLSEQGALTSWSAEGETSHQTKESGWAAGTHELESVEGQVRTSKQNERARGTGTHVLEEEEGNDSSRSRKESVQARGTHDLERAREGQVRIRK
jgi:hypothetical protein